MNAVLLHLSSSHFVVVLPIFALAFFIAALIKRKLTLYRIGAAFLILGALLVVPQYLSGQSAAETAEHDDVAHKYMETHEELATITLWLFVGSGIIALLGLWQGRSEDKVRPWLILLFLLSLASSISVGLTAHEGGMIRHAALRGETEASAPPASDHDHNNGHNHDHNNGDHDHNNGQENHDHNNGHEHEGGAGHAH